MFKKLKSKKGFTLIELIVVIAIIAILAAVLLPRFFGFTQSAGNKAVLSDAKNIQVATEAMIADGKATTGTSTSAIITYLGKDLGGVISPATFTIDASGDYSLTYAKTVSNTPYTATITSGGITVSP